MELVDHLGISFNGDRNPSNLYHWTRGVLCFIVLFHVILWYQIVAIICTLFAIFIPEIANSFRINFGNFFWDVSLYFIHFNKVKFRILGDRLDSNPAIIVSNHESLADFFVINYLARMSVSDKHGYLPHESEKLNLPVTNFFSWFLVWRVPTIKILLHMLKSDENWEIDQKSLGFVFSRLLRSKLSQWIVLFPEVNIWTKEGAGLQRQLSNKYYLPHLNHLLYPRFSGFANIISALESSKPHPYSNLYDVTILYSQRHLKHLLYNPPSLLEMFSCRNQIIVTIHIKVRPVSRIPVKRQKLERYLEHLWRHKDKLLCQLKTEQENDTAYNLHECVQSPSEGTSNHQKV